MRWCCGPPARSSRNCRHGRSSARSARRRATSAPQTLLSDLTLAIRKGAADRRIQALLIETDDLLGAGLPELEELAAAIAEFRRSGKKVIARGSYLLDSQYYLAAQADEVYLDPMGFVLLTGYDRYRMYFKDAIDKLKVDVHLVRAGKFKSAAEPFVRSDMSAEDREESAAYLRSLWLGYRRGVGRARHLDARGHRRLRQRLCRRGARFRRRPGAHRAPSAGLVTGLRTGPQVEQRMIELVGPDPDAHSFRAIQLDDYVRALHSETRCITIASAPSAWSWPAGRSWTAPRRRATSAATRPRPCCAARATMPRSRRSCCASTARGAACWPPSRSIAK